MPNNIRVQTIFALTSMTDVYQIGSTLSSAEDCNFLGLEILYKDSSAGGAQTSLQIKVEESMNGTDYFQQSSKSTSSGVATVSLTEYTFSTAGSYALQIHPVRANNISVKAKATGEPTSAAIVIKGYLTNNEIGMI